MLNFGALGKSLETTYDTPALSKPLTRLATGSSPLRELYHQHDMLLLHCNFPRLSNLKTSCQLSTKSVREIF